MGGTTRRAWALTALAMAALPARAQDRAWPSRAVRIIVPWAPGGGVDVIARRLAARLSEMLGQPFIVENRTGAAGTIGMGEVARAAPDGHTLLALDNSYTMLPHTVAQLPWDHATAFVPVVLGAAAPFMLGVASGARFADLRALLDAARVEPERISYGTGGAGSSPHFATAAFQQLADVRLLHVPYRGGAEAMVAVIGGQVDLVMVTASAALGQINGGRLRALAICGEARSPLVPNVPTFAEAGLLGMDAGIWAGLAAPRGTPEAILDRLESATRSALAGEEMQRGLLAQGLAASGLGRAGFARLVRDETLRWGLVATRAGIRPQ